MKTSCYIEFPDGWKMVHYMLPGIKAVVETHSRRVAAIARSLAPKKTGKLREGIIPSPWEEDAKSPYKIGRQVYMDRRMNDTFVKIGKNGTRWYYPASQEYGWLRGTPPGYDPEMYRADLKNPAYRYRALMAREKAKVPGKYFMRNARALGASGFIADIEEVVRDAASS